MRHDMIKWWALVYISINFWILWRYRNVTDNVINIAHKFSFQIVYWFLYIIS